MNIFYSFLFFIFSTETSTTTTFSTNKLTVEKEEKEHLLERLRKLLRNANLRGFSLFYLRN